MSGFLTFLRDVNDVIWVIPFTLLVCLGIYATLRLKGIQFRELPEIIRTLFSKRKDKDNSSLRVFLVSLGTTVGVGVITGPVLAIMAGGPGSIFWLWVFAFMSMAVSFMETTITQVYKVSNGKGGFRGGAAYSILHGLANPKLAVTATVNCITTFILRRIPFEINGDFREQRKRGVEEPAFSKSYMIDQSGITSWGDDQ